MFARVVKRSSWIRATKSQPPRGPRRGLGTFARVCTVQFVAMESSGVFLEDRARHSGDRDVSLRASAVAPGWEGERPLASEVFAERIDSQAVTNSDASLSFGV